jgi:hypothetical protein
LQVVQALSVQGVPDPFAAPVAVDETGLGEDLQVVGDLAEIAP